MRIDFFPSGRMSAVRILSLRPIIVGLLNYLNSHLKFRLNVLGCSNYFAVARRARSEISDMPEITTYSAPLHA